MPPIDWYFARENKQMGPVSSIELKRLADVGELRSDDLVWREGLAEWTLARNVHGLFEAESKPAHGEETQPAAAVSLAGGVAPAEKSPQPASPPAAARHPIDMLLDTLRSAVSAHMVEAIARVLRQCGLYGLMASMALLAVFISIETVKTGMIADLLTGVALLLFLAVLHYVAGKFCDALDRLNRTTHGSLATTAVPDCVAILSLVAGLAALLGSIALAVESAILASILPGIAALVVCGYVVVVALNPATLNVWIAADEARASDEAIGVLMFLVKMIVALTPVAFGVGVVCSTLLMGVACWQAMSGGEGLLIARMTAAAARAGLIYSAVLPLAAYLLFLLYSLVADFCRAVLSLPEKFDKMTAKEEDSESRS
jgi:hypothetical protein